MGDLWIRQGVGHYTEATDADLAERGYVKVWQDCPTCEGRGYLHRPLDQRPPRREDCPDCTDGKVPAEGVVNTIANVLHDHGDRTNQKHTADWQDCGGADIHGKVAERIAADLLPEETPSNPH